MEQIVNFVQEFIMGLLVLLAPVLTGFVIAWVKAQVDLAIQNLENSKPAFANALRVAVGLAVQAAEQAGLSGLVDDKKQYAFQIAQQWLDDAGWDEVNIDILEAAIEAEVNNAFPKEGAESRSYW